VNFFDIKSKNGREARFSYKARWVCQDVEEALVRTQERCVALFKAPGMSFYFFFFFVFFVFFFFRMKKCKQNGCLPSDAAEDMSTVLQV
jgi:hypothetical protein